MRDLSLMGELLKTVGISKCFGGLVAVDRVDFSVLEGDTRSIIGPNGAGKSTFFKLIAGEHKATAGKVFFNGQDITRRSQASISHLGIAIAYQITSIFPMLTVHENTRVAAQSRESTFNFWSKSSALREITDRAEQALSAVGLVEMKSKVASSLSHGDRKRLEIGIALATDPKLLLLDEPTAGLAPKETRQIIDLIKKISNHVTIILVEHKMKVVMEVSDNITVLYYGRLLAQGSPEEISENEEVRRAYLGGVKI